jgi:7-cyano-7-deazaguanine synthase
MGKKRAVVLLSGGIDSSTALAIALNEGYDCFALSFDYAQRHIIELDSAGKVARSLGVNRHLIIRFDMREIGGSALTSDIEVPKADEGTGRSETVTVQASPGYTPPSIPVTYVPARNTIFLSFGMGWAEVLRAEDIFIGANAVDYSGYPDCRPEFLKAFEEMANLATKISVEGTMRFRIHAPLLQMTKQEIIKKGIKLGLDYSLAWSCYDPQPGISGEMIPCGRCDSCRIRARGFRDAGMRDPLID